MSDKGEQPADGVQKEGKPDKKANNKKQSKNKQFGPKNQGAGPLPNHPLAAELPPPSKVVQNKSTQKQVKTTDESLVSESVFEVDSGFHAAQQVEFNPSLTGWTDLCDKDLCDKMFAEYRNDSGIIVAKDYLSKR